MITPRRTRLLSVPDLPTLQSVVAEIVLAAQPEEARHLAILVPTRGAAAQLRRTLEALLLGDSRRAAVFVVPELVTRDDWYDRLEERSPEAPSRLGDLERAVLLGRAAREAAAAGARPPFTFRPRLVGELVAFYDGLRRHLKSVDDLERLVEAELVASLELDRGARRLLEQTQFLVATFRAYERRLRELGRVDEHGLRAWLLESAGDGGFRRVVVTVADRAAEPRGLWPADFDLLARLPGLRAVDVLATHQVLAAGWRARLTEQLPGIEEEVVPAATRPDPVLVAPPESQSPALYHRYRDREEELLAVARALKAASDDGSGSRALDDRVAIVFERPLPYLYLARQVFSSAGVPYQALDALPLATEPYAAAFELVCRAVRADFTRRTLVELLRSPQFRFTDGERHLDRHDVAALDRALLEARYLGGRAHLLALTDAWAHAGPPVVPSARDFGARLARAARVARLVVTQLAPLRERRPASQHLHDVAAFLRAHERLPPPGEAGEERHLRARSAILGVLERLRDAHRTHDDDPCEFGDLASTIRRWIEAQTFAPRVGTGGVHLVEAEAARYGRFAHLYLVGLVEGEWPARSAPPLFYPASLLNELGWPREPERWRASRAAFHDLLRLPTESVTVSTFTLEDDAIVSPSLWLNLLNSVGLPVRRAPDMEPPRVTLDEGLSEEPIAPAAARGAAAAWLALRRQRTSAKDARFHGAAGPQAPRAYAVSRVERYLECPFKYFAAHVLDLAEERREEPTMWADVRGRFVHDLFRRFFQQWHAAGRGAITDGTLEAALEMFAALLDEALVALPDADRTLERVRLLGSAAAPGIAERVFRLEAERGVAVVDRWLEYPIEGTFDLVADGVARSVRLRGVVDRVDLLEDGTVYIFDYKTGRLPKPRRAVQLPVYSACLAQQLQERRGERWRIAQVGYLAFSDDRTFVEVKPPELERGQARFLSAIAGIEAGHFPPQPDERVLCTSCPYSAVCRKEYVGEEP